MFMPKQHRRGSPSLEPLRIAWIRQQSTPFVLSLCLPLVLVGSALRAKSWVSVCPVSHWPL